MQSPAFPPEPHSRGRGSPKEMSWAALNVLPVLSRSVCKSLKALFLVLCRLHMTMRGAEEMPVGYLVVGMTAIVQGKGEPAGFTAPVTSGTMKELHMDLHTSRICCYTCEKQRMDVV